MVNTDITFEEIIEIQNKSIEAQYQHWINNELFTLQFWLLMVILIVPWLIWWKSVDRKRIVEILLYGLLVHALVTVIDEIGCQLNFWEYRYDIEPLFPRLISINFTALPIVYMFLYQYFDKWKDFLVAHVVAAGIMSFVMEPILVWLDIYELFNWKHVYSFPIYIIIAMFFKLVMKIILKKQNSHFK